MKKTVLTAVVAVAIGFTASAQEPVKFGVKAGAVLARNTISASGMSVNTSYKPSFYVGGTLDVAISEVFTFQPGLSFIGKGSKSSGEIEADFGGNTASSSQEQKLNIYYLEIPLNVLANFEAGDGKFFVGAGPYYAFGITGKNKLKTTSTANGTTTSSSESEDLKFGSGDDSNLKRGDFGVNFLVGYQLSSGLNIHAGYGLGLSNIAPGDTDGAKLKNNTISLGLGFSF